MKCNKVSCVFGEDGLISLDRYNLVDIHARAVQAMGAVGITLEEVYEKFGVDLSVPHHLKKRIQPSPMSIVKASEIIGVSDYWILTGRIATCFDKLVSDRINGTAQPITYIVDSTVISGNKDAIISVNNGTLTK